MKVFLLTLLIWVNSIGFTQTMAEWNFSKLESYLDEMVRDWGIPSLTVGIVKDGKLVFTKGYGEKQPGNKIAPDENTLYAIASNSKAFTSAIIGMLVQEKKIQWDDPVQKYLPYFEVYDPYISKLVTIRDLLCHRIGLGTFSGDVIWYQSDFTAEEMIRRIKYLPAKYPFRSGYGYSNLMYVTAGEVIRVVTGKSWATNVEERIFKPLGMSRYIIGPKKLQELGNVATPHSWSAEKGNVPIEWVDWTEVAATGGIISSVHDITKWINFNLNHGIWEGDTLLRKNVRNTLWTPHNMYTVDHTIPNDFNTHLSGYALGWNVRDYDGNLMVSHTGGFDGMLTAISLIPDQKLGIVVLSNGMKSPFLAANFYMLDFMLKRPEKDWSGIYLERWKEGQQEDHRIIDRIQKRQAGTSPSLPLEDYSGIFKSHIHGELIVTLEEDKSLRLQFDRAPDLSASLEHWHYDVFKLNWDKPSAWYSFGTVQFLMDNNLEVTGMEFDVPNDDIFFEELKPFKIK